jgi:hypothetical protein
MSGGGGDFTPERPVHRLGALRELIYSAFTRLVSVGR